MRKILSAFLLVICTLLLVACTNEKEIEGETITVKHKLGSTVVSVDIKKAVVFDLGILDIMQQLEVDVKLGAPVASLPAYLSEYKNAKNIGTLVNANLEAIYEFDPDVIIISGRQESNYEELKKLAPTIFVEANSATYLKDLEYNINLVAKLFHAEEKAESLMTEINELVEEVKALTNHLEKKALVVLLNGDTMSAYGSGSRFGLVHDVLGLKQADTKIEASTHGQSINYEYLSKTNPDIILVVDRSAVVEGSQSQNMFNNELLKNMSAYVNDDIHYLNAVAWYTVSGGVTSTKQMIQDVKNALIK